MALTYGTPTRLSIGARYEAITKVTFDTSYVEHGYELELKKLVNPELADLEVALIEATTANNESTGAYVTFINNVSPYKLQLFGGAASGVALAEVTSTTNVSAYFCYVKVIGR
jgi:hypothetical protein